MFFKQCFSLHITPEMCKKEGREMLKNNIFGSF